MFYTLLMLCAWYSEGKPGKPWLTFSNETEMFELNKDLLLEIAELQGPTRVIAVIGVSRIGKSTTLNLINHIWCGANQTYIEEVFKTGDSFLPVTRDVWAQVIQPRDEQGGNVVLLDVEGTNLGDGSVYDTKEKNVCSRSYIKFVEPLFAELTADIIEAKLEDTLRAFKME